MKKAISLGSTILLLGTCTGAQTPKRIQITGSKALQLVSLLVSGSDAIGAALGSQHKNEIVLHDFSVMSASTYKLEPDDPGFKLALYSAQGKIGSATNPTQIHEATALYKFFADLGIEGDLGLEGYFFEMTTVDCKIDVTADIASLKRAQCDMLSPH
jgi:hypothetical protein